MHDYHHSLGDCVKQAREKLGLSQVKVGEMTGMDSRTILNIENYSGNPKMNNLYPLVRALHLDPVKIFYPEVEAPRSNYSELDVLIAQCSEEDKEALLPICKAALEAIHSRDKIEIKGKK